ncbi:MAG: ChaN family lipoprotein [Gammaproteobacteria bacterium]
MTLKKLKHSLKHLPSVLVLLLLVFQSSVTAQQEPEGWQSPFFQDNKLVGKIWDTHKNAWLSMEQFNRELLQYDYILLGETHTNADHHTLQAKVINALVKSGVKPIVVMEMLSIGAWEDQPHTWGKSDELQELASMLNDGWPWELYAPILQSVVQHRLELHAGNISSDKLHRWSNQQSEEKKQNLLREYFYTNDDFSVLEKIIIDSHCGHANQGFIDFMSRAQMRRDRVMTTLLLEKKLPVVFIAGRGHIRNDYAVPMQLRRGFNETSYLSVAFMPVREGEEDPKEYLQDESKLYDILYFTPSHTNEDPCVKFRKQLKNMQLKHQ